MLSDTRLDTTGLTTPQIDAILINCVGHNLLKIQNFVVLLQPNCASIVFP